MIVLYYSVTQVFTNLEVRPTLRGVEIEGCITLLLYLLIKLLSTGDFRGERRILSGV